MQKFSLEGTFLQTSKDSFLIAHFCIEMVTFELSPLEEAMVAKILNFQA